MIEVHNDGPLVTATNYFQTPNAAAGYVYATINARTFRLFCPDPAAVDHRGAKYVRFAPPGGFTGGRQANRRTE